MEQQQQQQLQGGGGYHGGGIGAAGRRVANFVWTGATLLSGKLLDCRSPDDPSCAGGIAAVRANLRLHEARYDEEEQRRGRRRLQQELEPGPTAAAAEDDGPADHQGQAVEQASLVIPRLDYESAFAQMHELEWAVNRLVFHQRFGWESWYVHPCAILYQDRDDSLTTSRDLDGLQTNEWRPLMTNIQIPTSNSWSPYVENVHLDADTGLAVIAFHAQSCEEGPKDAKTGHVDSARAMLAYVADLNRDLPRCPPPEEREEEAGTGPSGATPLLSPYQAFLLENGQALFGEESNATASPPAKGGNLLVPEPPECWIPVVVWEQSDPDAFAAFVEAMRSDENPPGVIVDVMGNNLTAAAAAAGGDEEEVDGERAPRKPTKNYLTTTTTTTTTARGNGNGGGIWVLSYYLHSLAYFQQRLIVGKGPNGGGGRGRVVDVDLIESPMFEIPKEIREDEEFADDLTFLRKLADQAAENDPVVGRSAAMPPVHAGGGAERSFPCFGGECPVGNLYADAIRWKGKADVAFVQSGGVTGPGWPAGNVSVSNLWEALPFPNTLCNGVMSGLSLFRIFNYSTSMATFESTYHPNGDRLFQVSGMRYTYNTELPESGRLIGIEIFNDATGEYEPLERLKLYSFSTSSWMCGGFHPLPSMLGEQLVMTGEVPGAVERGGLLQSHAADFLRSLEAPYDTSIQGRLINDTLAFTPLDMVQTKESCRAGTYWVENQLTCFDCPSTTSIYFSEERLVFDKAIRGLSNQTGTARIVNEDEADIDIELKSFPDWVEFAAVRQYTKSGYLQAEDGQDLITAEQLTVTPGGAIEMELIASAVNLDVGSALGAVSFAVLFGSGEYRGCVGRDATFEVFMEVSREPQLNRPGSVQVAGLSLMAIAMLAAVTFALWVWKNRKHSVINAMQPFFLIAICFGSFVMSISILPLTIEDDVVATQDLTQLMGPNGVTNLTCMALPWLLSTGFVLVTSSLFAKLLRINKVFCIGRPVRKQVVTIKQSVLSAGVLFTLNFIIVLLWQLIAPLKYMVQQVDAEEEEWNLYGSCRSMGTASNVLGGLSLGLNMCALLLACHQAWKARNISTDFSESRHLGYALFSWLELMLVGLPLLFLVQKENANARYFLMVSLIFAITMAMLLIIFLPLMMQMRNENTRVSEVQRTSSVFITGLQQGSSSLSMTGTVPPDSPPFGTATGPVVSLGELSLRSSSSSPSTGYNDRIEPPNPISKPPLQVDDEETGMNNNYRRRHDEAP